MTDTLVAELAKYIIGHWETLIVAIPCAIGSLVGGTWFAARHWYEREIAHHKNEYASATEAYKREISFLKDQLTHKEAYARGAVELVSQRLLIAQEEPKRLLNIIRQQEQQLVALQRSNTQLQDQGTNTDGSPVIFVSSYPISRNDVDKLFAEICGDDPNDPRLSNTRRTYNSTQAASISDSAKLSAAIAAMTIMLKIQREKISGLNLSLNRAQLDSSSMHNHYFKFLHDVLEPLASSSSQWSRHSKLKEIFDSHFHLWQNIDLPKESIQSEDFEVPIDCDFEEVLDSARPLHVETGDDAQPINPPDAAR